MNLDWQNIHSKNSKNIIEYIQNFPVNNYNVCDVQEVGSFYLEKNEYDVIKSYLSAGNIWETHIISQIKQHIKPGSIAVDIGAHIGTHTITMAKAIGSNGRVLAFEPQPKMFRELFMNLNNNKIQNVDYYWAAVGSSKGDIELKESMKGNEGCNCLLNGIGTGQFVEIVDLDSLNLSNVSFIKIDAEFMEYDVLVGAQSTLLKNKPVIVIEIQGPRTELTKTKLEELGYSLTYLKREMDYLAIPN